MTTMPATSATRLNTVWMKVNVDRPRIMTRFLSSPPARPAITCGLSARFARLRQVDARHGARIDRDEIVASALIRGCRDRAHDQQAGDAGGRARRHHELALFAHLDAKRIGAPARHVELKRGR